MERALIVDQVVELEEVDPAHRDVVIELFAGTAVIHDALAVLAETGLLERLADGQLVGAVEDRRCHLPAEGLGRIAEVNLEDLADVHTRGNAQGVQDDVQRRAVGQIGHILTRENARDDALVAVAAGHLVADRDLALLRDVDADDLVDAGIHLVAALTGEDIDIDDDAAFTVGHLQRGIADLAGLLTEDGAQEALFRGEIGLALRRDLADEDVAGGNLGQMDRFMLKVVIDYPTLDEEKRIIRENMYHGNRTRTLRHGWR